MLNVITITRICCYSTHPAIIASVVLDMVRIDGMYVLYFDSIREHTNETCLF